MTSTNHIQDLLSLWFPQRDSQNWVLGTVYKTEGPTYRKAGAMMLFNDLGQQFGLLSGGCLEADIQQQAAKVMRSEQAIKLCYDGSDEDDVSFLLGIGCGGTVHILLQALNANTHYLGLIDAHNSLQAGKAGVFSQEIPKAGETNANWLEQGSPPRAELQETPEGLWLKSPITPPPRLLVVGGGADARPMLSMAANLGWSTVLWDSRPANARREYFPSANIILRDPIETIAQLAEVKRCDAAVVMSHNLQLDASAIQQLQHLELRYLALLGPEVRKARVLALAGLTDGTLRHPISGPAGFRIGAELPEGIALSILAECHAELFNTLN